MFSGLEPVMIFSITGTGRASRPIMEEPLVPKYNTSLLFFKKPTL
jgi:hypothetical protein